jgi:hypothetical protein
MEGMTEPLSRDDFEAWLFDMDDALEDFHTAVPGLPFDFTVGSLRSLEGWLLARYRTPEALAQPSEERLLDGAARYLGEVMRRQVGGTWDIVLDDPKFIYGRLPILRVPNRRNVPFCPHFTVRLAVKRRAGDLLTSVVTKAIQHADEVGAGA